MNLNHTNQGDNSLLIGSHNNGPLLVGCVNPQFNTLVLKNYKIKCKVDADSYFSSKTNDIIKLESKELFYDKLIQSSYFGIYTVKNVSKNLSTWNINDIQRKVMLLSMKSISIAIPLLHSS